MGSYLINAANPLAAQVWAKAFSAEALRESFFGQFIGRDRNDGTRLDEHDPGAMIALRTELETQAGDTITVPLRAQLAGDGKSGQVVLEGSEEAIDWRYDSVEIDKLRHAVRREDNMTTQRAAHDLRMADKHALLDWITERKDQILINHLSGDTLVTSAEYTGHNAIVAPTYHYMVESSANTDEADVNVNQSSIFTFNTIAAMKNIARQKRMRPVQTPKGPKFILFIHDEVEYQLRTNTDNGQFVDIQKAAMQGGRVNDNPLFTGAMGEFSDVIIHTTDRLPNGNDGSAYLTNTRRSVLCGAGAVSLAYGQDEQENNISYVEEGHDYGDEKGTAIKCKFGMKRSRYTPLNGDQTPDASGALDFSTIVVTSYTTGVQSQI